MIPSIGQRTGRIRSFRPIHVDSGCTLRLVFLRRRVSLLVIALGALPLFGQQVKHIDLTTETQRVELRYPPAEPNHTGGVGGGSIGDCGLGAGEPRSLTVSIESVLPSNADPLKPIEVQFRVLNTGQVPLELPVSPHLADLQPQDASLAFTYKSLALSIAPEEDRSAIGFVELYGNNDAPGTLITLNPGMWIRVEGILRFPIKPLQKGVLHLASGYWLRSVTFHPHPGGYSTAAENVCWNRLPTPPIPFERY
jgi:hypothetical protein